MLPIFELALDIIKYSYTFAIDFHAHNYNLSYKKSPVLLCV